MIKYKLLIQIQITPYVKQPHMVHQSFLQNFIQMIPEIFTTMISTGIGIKNLNLHIFQRELSSVTLISIRILYNLAISFSSIVVSCTGLLPKLMLSCQTLYFLHFFLLPAEVLFIRNILCHQKNLLFHVSYSDRQKHGKSRSQKYVKNYFFVYPDQNVMNFLSVIY